MDNNQEKLAVNLDKAEFIISLASQKNGFRSIMLLLREIEDQFITRQKQNKTFYKVSQIIEHGYSKKTHSDKQLIKRIQHELQQQEKDTEHLSQKRTALKQELDAFEAELSGIREYAEQRRNKKSKRERQYHQLYHVPILASQFKKKYVRARDKNSDAEEQVSHMRSKVDACQQEISHISKTITDIQKHREQSVQRCKNIESQLKKDQELVFQLQEGRKFLAGFDQYQFITAQKATTQFIEAVQASYSNNQAHKIRDPNQNFVKFFKLALFEYGEAEKFADHRWGRIKVPFSCMKCQVTQVGWPKLDKIKTNEFICDTCFQEHHASMVFEKKMTGIKDQLLFDTKKPGIKKMVKKMLKVNSSQMMIAQ